MRRRIARLVSVATCAAVLGIGACGGGEGLPAAPQPAATTPTRLEGAPLFAVDSVWNAPLAADAPLDPSSPRLVQSLVREAERERQARNGAWIQTSSYSTPIYRVGADQPPVRVVLENSSPWARTLSTALRAVPIPPDARPAAGTDAHMTIWQPSTDRLWELWKARREADGWHAAWGGAIARVSKSPGYFTPDSWPGARSYWGATATSLPVVAGTMTIAELERGRIDHALALNLPSLRANAYTWPAQRTDGVDPDPDAIPAGAHLRIDPRIDIRSLYLPRLTEMMALAAQRYGMIARDETHHAIGFFAEDPAPTGSNPYPALMDYRYPNELLSRFPWDHVQVLRMDVRRGTGRPR
jgi:hypothetical protein